MTNTEKVNVHSEALGKDMRVNVFVPDGYAEGHNSYPVLYLLHGKDGNENTWNRDMDVAGKALSLIQQGKIQPLLIVMPNYENSYGTNYSDTVYTKDGRQYGRYEDYLTRELIDYIDSHYRTIKSREGRYIGGLSMGGFTAVYYGMSHSDLFSKSGGHSPAMFLDPTDQLKWLYKDEEMRKRTDPLLLVNQMDLNGVHFFLDYGDHDMQHVKETTDQLYQKLTERGAQVQFHTSSGGHDKGYWKSNTEKYLIFYSGSSS